MMIDRKVLLHCVSAPHNRFIGRVLAAERLIKDFSVQVRADQS